MKTLESTSETLDTDPVCFWLRFGSTMAVGIALLLLALWLYRFPATLIQRQARQQAEQVVSLATETAVQTAQRLRQTLMLVARNPELRQIKSGSRLLVQQQELAKNLSLLLESYEPTLGHVYEQILKGRQSLDWVYELSLALWRRIWLTLGIYKPDDNDAAAQQLLAPRLAGVTAKELARIARQAGLVNEKATALRQFVHQITENCMPLLLALENRAGMSQQMLSDRAMAENYLVAVLNDEIFRALILRSLDGEVLAMVGDFSAASLNLDQRDCRAIKNGSLFFSGPVGYDQRQGHAQWWVAVPVRDQARNPVACLTALIDLDFLTQAAKSLSSSSNLSGKLFYTDSSGVVIGAADQTLVAKQISLARIQPVLKSGHEPNHRLIIHEGQQLFQAGASIKTANARYLPDWCLCYEQNLSVSSSSGQFLVLVSVILLAAMGVYAISCSFVRW